MIFSFVVAVFICHVNCSPPFPSCLEILSNQDLYPFSVVNECIKAKESVQLSDSHVSLNCQTLKCKNSCLFGWLEDNNKCKTCQCKTASNLDLFEGDIKVVGEMVSYIENMYKKPPEEINENLQLTAATAELPLWKIYSEEENYVMPYLIDKSIGDTGKQAIEEAAKDFENFTCIRLRPRVNQATYVKFYDGGICASPVGAVESPLKISLADGCWKKGTVIHEILHALGFWHEQSRPDRDKYIEIKEENVKEWALYNFNKKTNYEVTTFGLDYDTSSVMHYNGYAFTSNKKPTIIDKSTGEALQAQREGFSKLDIEAVNKLYGCKYNTTITTANRCIDLNSNCAHWANKGLCVRNKAFMAEKCCLSCKKATNVTHVKKCIDTHNYCIMWAKRGHCKSSRKNYMKKKCCDTCKNFYKNTKVITTTTVQPTSAITVVACVDKVLHCRFWARTGYCAIASTYLSIHCCASCKGKLTSTTSPTETQKNKTTTTLQAKTTKVSQTTTSKSQPTTTTTIQSTTTQPTTATIPTTATLPTTTILLTTTTTTQTTTTQTTTSPTTKIKITTTRKKTNCTDRKRFCAQWASYGFCEGRYAKYMKKNCKNSCSFC